MLASCPAPPAFCPLPPALCPLPPAPRPLPSTLRRVHGASALLVVIAPRAACLWGPRVQSVLIPTPPFVPRSISRPRVTETSRPVEQRCRGPGPGGAVSPGHRSQQDPGRTGTRSSGHLRARRRRAVQGTPEAEVGRGLHGFRSARDACAASLPLVSGRYPLVYPPPPAPSVASAESPASRDSLPHGFQRSVASPCRPRHCDCCSAVSSDVLHPL